MNIGIYGDSFAEFNDSCPNFHWSVKLSKKFDNCHPEHYGEPGSSIFYSYQKFLKKYKKQDLIIFMVTDPCRFTTKINVNDEPVWINYLNTLDHYEKEHSDLSKTDIAMLTNLRGWFLSSDHEFLKTVSELMLSHMHMLHDNIIFFPCFSESFDCAKYNFPKDQCMYNYVLRARTLLNLPTENWDMKTEVSKNIAQHLTPEFNDFVAEVLYNKITTGVWDFSKLENVKLQHTKEQYYIL
jgi:hypothetical protein